MSARSRTSGWRDGERRRRTRVVRASRGRRGYAAVDALVALTILTTTLVLALSAGAQARDAARLADETHMAGDLMQSLIAPVGAGVRQGVTGAFAWTISEAVLDRAPGSALGICRREVELKSRTTGRRYALASASLCSAGNAR